MGEGVHPLPHIPPSLLPVFRSAELLPGSKSRLLVVEEGYNLQTRNLRRKNQPANVAAEHANIKPLLDVGLVKSFSNSVSCHFGKVMAAEEVTGFLFGVCET